MSYDFYSIVEGLKIKDSWKEINPCDVLLISHENDKVFKFRGKFYSHILDSISCYFDSKNISSMTKGFSRISSDETYANAKTYSRLWLFNKIVSSVLTMVLGDNNVYFKLQARFWKKLISRVEPKVVIIVQADEALCSVCHELGVKVYDFQHGVITDSMPVYGQEFQSQKPKELLPSGYLCWDTDSCNIINSWSLDKGIIAHHIGNPWLHRFGCVEKGDELVQDELNKVSNLFGKNDNVNIVVTMQWGLSSCYPEYFSEGEYLKEELFSVIKNTCTYVNWYIRLHPIQVKDNTIYNALQDKLLGLPNVEIDISTRIPFPLLLSKMDAHVTWDSSSVIEATTLGIPSFVLNPGYFSELQTPKALQGVLKINEPLPYSTDMHHNTVTRSIGTVSSGSVIEWIKTLKKIENNKKAEFNSQLLRELIIDNNKRVKHD